jgi:hypothetical protein
VTNIKAIELTGNVVGHKTHQHFNEGGRQDYFLFIDENSGMKYPLYVSSSKFLVKKTAKALMAGHKVRVRGKLQTTFSITPQAQGVIEKSDLGFRRFILISYARVLVPEEVELLEDPAEA